MLVNDSNDGHTHFANQQILTCAQTIHWLRRARKGHRLQKGWEFSIEYLNCYSVLILCTYICLTHIKLQIFGLLFGTVPTWNPFCVWGVLVFASWEHLACSWLLLVVDCGSWLLADIFWHHLLSTGWFLLVVGGVCCWQHLVPSSPDGQMTWLMDLLC